MLHNHPGFWRFIILVLFLSDAGASATFLRGAQAATKILTLHLRSRVEPFKGTGDWREVNFEAQFPIDSTAIVICDMWDKHWCSGASARVDILARKMAPVIDQARASGIQIIHAPSDVVGFYAQYPQRIRIPSIPVADPPRGLDLPDPPLPIDDADGGCDTADKFYQAWSREHPALSITGDDVISADGKEIYSFLAQRGIKNLLVMGVHANMCILNRSFAIKQMTRWGIHCVLVRDLTDSMYDPQDRPYVRHDQGTELVVEYIEQNWCPSALSTDLVQGLRH